jgi:D-amino peptidase
MKFYITTDLEGPALVSRFAQTRDYQDALELKREAMTLLTGEVNAAINGILDADPEAEIIVWDGHGNGGIDVMAFHRQAKLITRGPIKPPYFLDSTFAAQLFVGQHAMANTPDAPLCHTYSSKTIDYYKLNGQFVGEFGARTIMAGTFGVPTIFISGDDKAVEEARALVPGIYGAVVKEGLGRELALHLSHKAACELIRKTAAEAVRHIGDIPPVRVEPPYEQEIRVLEGVSIGGYLEAGAERLDDRTVIFRSNDICDLRI